jgi:hypothetical protein
VDIGYGIDNQLKLPFCGCHLSFVGGEHYVIGAQRFHQFQCHMAEATEADNRHLTSLAHLPVTQRRPGSNPGAQQGRSSLIPALSLSRWEAPTEPTSYMHETSICLAAQGTKRVLLGEEVYVYDAHHFLVTSVDLPVVAQVIDASREKPYLGLKLKLDQRAIAQLMVDSSLPLPRAQEAIRGMAVSEVSLPLLNAFQRLIDLLDEPEDIPILAPLIQREILCRLLVGDQGPRLRQIGAAGSQSHEIARAIDWLKGNFTRPLRIDALAA